MGTEAALCFGVSCGGTGVTLSPRGLVVEGQRPQTASFFPEVRLWFQALMITKVLAVSTSTHRW